MSWRLNRAATVRLTFQKQTRQGLEARRRRSRAPGKAGAGEVRFRGRFGSELLKPQRYRLVVVARGGGGDRDRLGPPVAQRGFRVLKVGMSDEERPRRFGRRRADFEALEVAGESLGALRAELVLLREENARLKAAPPSRAGPHAGCSSGRARCRPRASTTTAATRRRGCSSRAS